MHNLAVLDADGGGKGANYKSASIWFRKAADRGVADSQFNLGILYARGIGVEQNLAESFKWFSLAAAQGDADAGTQARRYRQAPRRPVAGGSQACDPDLYAGAAARRRRQRRAVAPPAAGIRHRRRHRAAAKPGAKPAASLQAHPAAHQMPFRRQGRDAPSPGRVGFAAYPLAQPGV